MMDDFLEMEKLASANGSSRSGEAEDAGGQLAKLEEKVRRLMAEKANREKALHEAQREARASRHQAMVAEERSAELQRQLNLANGEKHAVVAEMEAAETKRNELEGELEMASDEVAGLLENTRILEERLESEKAMTLELAGKYQHMDALESEMAELRRQLEASQSDAGKLGDQITSLERSLEEEKAFSAPLMARCHGIDALEAKKKSAEVELESARERVTSFEKKVTSLELKVEEERALSDELARRCRDLEALDAQRTELGSQLQSADSEIVGLKEKVKMLETVEKHKPMVSELESQLGSAQAEIKNLKENVSLLEKKLESQKNLSPAYINALDASEAEKNKLASRFELKEREAEELHKKISSLEQQIHEGRAQCQNLKEEIASRATGYQPEKPMANKGLFVKKEKELARAAGKLANCQKTIASLSSRLKSLADFDGSLIESWDDLKLFDSASHPPRLGCLAVT